MSSVRPDTDKAIGICLAAISGFLIGVSLVLKKRGLLNANKRNGEAPATGYGYLRDLSWWSGMIMLTSGEVCNFAAYGYTDAIVVTPMGAISVVVCAALSSYVLDERLILSGKIACLLCVLGSAVIALNGPDKAAIRDIEELQLYVVKPGFLTFAGVVILISFVLAFWTGPKYGDKNIFVFLSVCSLIGGLSVVAIQGLGSAFVAQGRGEAQFDNWFLYIVLCFAVVSLLTEVVYLNKALSVFNAAVVTPIYYVYFTTASIVTSAVLFRGFDGSPVQISTVVLGFLIICSGVTLLHVSLDDGTSRDTIRLDVTEMKPTHSRSHEVARPQPNSSVSWSGTRHRRTPVRSLSDTTDISARSILTFCPEKLVQSGPDPAAPDQVLLVQSGDPAADGATYFQARFSNVTGQ